MLDWFVLRNYTLTHVYICVYIVSSSVVVDGQEYQMGVRCAWKALPQVRHRSIENEDGELALNLCSLNFLCALAILF